MGLTLAAKLAESRQVFGLEIAPEVRAKIKQGKAHFFEPGLDELVGKAVGSGMLVVSGSTSEIPPEVRDFVITVGTPISGRGVDLSYIDKAVSEISDIVTDDSCIILRSTVALGVTRARVAGKFSRQGKFPKVAMCPERTIEGRALLELSELPQVVGAMDEDSFRRAASVFSTLECPIERVSSPEAAECVKLITNTYRDVTFAFANEVALFSQAVNLDAAEVITAANRGYPRSNIPAPGLTGGPCLEKDPWIFSNSARDHGVELLITKSSRLTHQSVIPACMPEIVNLYNSSQGSPSGIVVAGLAFKGRPATSDVRGSLAKDLCENLSMSLPEAELFGFDPYVSESDVRKLGFEGGGDLSDMMGRSRLLIIQNNNEKLLEMLAAYFSSGPIWHGQVFDFTGAFRPVNPQNVNVTRFGVGAER